MKICDLNCEIEGGKQPSLQKAGHIIWQDEISDNKVTNTSNTDHQPKVLSHFFILRWFLGIFGELFRDNDFPHRKVWLSYVRGE